MHPDGGVETPGGRNQPEAYSAALEECQSELLERYPPRPDPISRGEWQLLYERQVATAECLRSLGYDGEIPSLDSYISNEGSWLAYDWVGEPSADEWQELAEQCPQP
ncbi:MAG TPA: hypothetical protein VE569_02060 [Acidimicrobiia bacterium]|nr:hypothetical protein [Acidimicrobiia bacterium]